MAPLTAVIQERVDKFKSDLDRFEAAREVDVKYLADLILDPNRATKPVADQFIFSALHVPASYFRRAGTEHQAEIMNFAVRSNPNLRVKVLEDANTVYAAGPADAAPFSSIRDVVNSFPGSIQSIDGSLFEHGQVRIFKATPSNTLEKFSYGAFISISSLFSRGYEITPSVMELRCTNGLMDFRNIIPAFRLRPEQCVEAALNQAAELAETVVNNRVESYETLLNSLESTPPMDNQRLIDYLVEKGFPKSYVKKVQPTLISLQEGTLNVDVLPTQMVSFLDQVSVLTFSAQEFATRTRSRIEALSFETALELARVN